MADAVTTRPDVTLSSVTTSSHVRIVIDDGGAIGAASDPGRRADLLLDGPGDPMRRFPDGCIHGITGPRSTPSLRGPVDAPPDGSVPSRPCFPLSITSVPASSAA